MEQEPELKELSPEEYKQRKAELIKYYEEEIPFLTKSHEHHRLITELEEFRARYLRAQLMIANIEAGPPEPSQEKPIRALRKGPV